MRAYNEDYLFDAMETLSEAFDYAVNQLGFTAQQFFDLFVSTSVADAFGTGAPRYIAGTSGAEFLLDSAYRAGIDVGIMLGDNSSSYIPSSLICRVKREHILVGRVHGADHRKIGRDAYLMPAIAINHCCHISICNSVLTRTSRIYNLMILLRL